MEPATAARIVDGLSGAVRVLTLLVAATGLRISEALGLKWEDVDWTGQRIHLRRVWVGKRAFSRLKSRASRAKPGSRAVQ